MSDELHVSALNFENPKAGQLFHAFLEGARSLCSGWKYRPFERSGNFIRAHWATGTGARDDCQIAGGSAHRRDQRALALSTLFYPKAPIEVFGLNFALLVVPPDDGWGFSLSLSFEGKTVMGEGLHLNFHRYESSKGNPVESLHLGSRICHRAFDTEVSVNVARSPLELLRCWLDAPEQFVGQSQESLERLDQCFREALAAGEIQNSEEGPYKNDGIPPERFPRPLTEEEREEAGRLWDAEKVRQQATLRREGGRFHSLLLSSFPLQEVLTKVS